ncbi:MAG: sugar ABC transporter substrate-binding protein [Turicibacter sp.]
MKRIIYIICLSVGLYLNIERLDAMKHNELTVWVSSQEYELLKDINPTFEQQYHVNINMQIMTPEQAYSNLPLTVETEKYPDIVALDHTMIADMVKQKAIAPLNDIFETLNILPTVKQGFKVMGNYYGVPYEAMTDILYYDKDKFEEGISSFSEFENNRDASLVFNYRDLYHITPFLTGYGGYTVGINNFGDTNFYDIGLNREESIAGFLKMIQMLNKNIAYVREGDIYKAFIDKKADLLIAPASLFSSLTDVYPNLGYQAIPNFVEEILPYTYMKMGTYQLTSGSGNKELAQEYLKFLISDEVASARYELTKAIAPVDYEVPIAQDEYYTVVKKQLHRSLPLPNQSEFNYVYLPYKAAASKFVNMPDQLQSILNDAVKEIDSVLEGLLK